MIFFAASVFGIGVMVIGLLSFIPAFIIGVIKNDPDVIVQWWIFFGIIFTVVAFIYFKSL